MHYISKRVFILQQFVEVRFNSVRSKTTHAKTHLHDLLLTMPKEQVHTAELKKHRLKLKQKGQKYAPGIVNLQVLGSGALGAPKSLYLFTDHSRYLFNCGEGSQRLAHEHKMKLSKLEHIFITYPTWANLGGLPGLTLTIQDVGVPEIKLHGPPGVADVFKGTERFVVLKHLSISSSECSEKDDCGFEDPIINVDYVPIFSNAHPEAKKLEDPAGDEDRSEDETDYYAHERYSVPKNKKRKVQGRNRTFSSSSSTSSRDMAVSYIVKLHPRPGTLVLEKCVEAGVPPGPLLGKLKAGEDVVLNDGTLVKSEDVRLPDDPGPVFLVVDCPSEEFLDSFLGNNKFYKHTVEGAESPDRLPIVIAHFTPPHILQHPRYIEWMDKFPLSTSHLILNEDNECMGSVAVHRLQHKLHMIHPDIFPLLADKGIPLAGSSPSSPSSPSLQTQFKMIYARTLTKFALRPNIGSIKDDRLTLDPNQYISEVTALDEFEATLSELQTKLKDSKPGSAYPYLLFLGTGSCIPNKARNTSAIFLRLAQDKSMLLDCGEGTFGQLVRFYGRDQIADILASIKAVYVSHLHADHHIGLIGLLKARAALSPGSPPLFLLAPKQISTWLRFYHIHFDRILHMFQLMSNVDLDFEHAVMSVRAKSSLLSEIGLSDVTTCKVSHCPNAFGISLTFPNGFKMTYSGDTMPCPPLVKMGHGSNLLIHEATMEDELAEEAKAKFHSTTSQAVDAGHAMNAGFTLLTHFSQRYAKLPVLNPEFTDTVGIAFDNMKIPLDAVSTLPLLYPALRVMFQEDYEILQIKSLKRQMRQKLESESAQQQ